MSEVGWGTKVRHRMGRYEVPLSELYRAFFIDLDALVGQVSTGDAPRRILEIGCGDGALAQRLTQAFPAASYVGIDPAPSAGRLYRGRSDGVSFLSTTSGELARTAPEPYDLVVICDVLHHIPGGGRTGVLQDAADLTAPGGRIVVKEWAIDRPVVGKLAYWADLYVTRDRQVDFMTASGVRDLLRTTLPGFELEASSHVRPWKENVLLVLRKP